MNTTAAKLVKGSARLDEMWKETKLVVAMMFSSYAGDSAPRIPFKVTCKNGLIWTMAQTREGIDMESFTSICFCQSTDIWKNEFVWNANPKRPGSDFLLKLHGSLDELVAAMFKEFPFMRAQLAAIITAGS